MNITQAGPDDIDDLARLLWRDTHHEEPDQPSADAFAVELAQWCDSHHETHTAFVARNDSPALVGMAWVALLPRIPRPGAMNRMSADIQTVFVMPQHRGQGIGSALVDAATQHAFRLGAIRVTVHSGDQALIFAVPMGLMGGIATCAFVDLTMRSCPDGLQGTLMMLVEGIGLLSLRASDTFGSAVYDANPHYGFLYCVIATTVVYSLILPTLLTIPKGIIATSEGVAIEKS